MLVRGIHSSWLRQSVWPAVAVLAACIPFAGALSTTHIFHLRDLTMYFWPTHLWLRDTLWSGVWPSWDPYAAGGQPTDSNALNQMFLPPVLLLRILLPPVLGFNAIVATPFPLGALGMWLYLNRRVSGPSATVGAIAFAASGPMVSSGNFPNLSWSMAWLPWFLWTLDRDRERPSSRSFAMLALMAALQMLSGEPVTMIGTLAIATIYVLTHDAPPALTARARRLARFASAVLVASLIATIQLVPTFLASRGSVRSLLTENTFWSLHPLWLTEALLPKFFGHAFENWQAELPWLWPLNSGRDPLFYSLYVGGLVTVLAVAGARVGDRRWARFWLLVGAVSLICAFGGYTPIYPFLQDVLPVVRGFRFPLKFFLFTAFALAVLAADGVHAWMHAPQSTAANRVITRTSVVACVAVAVLIGAFLLLPFAAARGAFELGRLVQLADPVAGASFLFRSASTVAVRALALIGLGALLAYWALLGHGRRTLAVSIFCVVALGDLLVVNAKQNPSMPASLLGPPDWAQAVRARPSDRFYFGGKFGGRLLVGDPDIARTGWESPPGTSFADARTLFMAQLAMAPAGWRLREILSHDLPLLRPIVQMEPLGWFLPSDRAARLRFLARSGVRYCVLGAAPFEGAVPLAQVGHGFSSMAVYECLPDARRAYVVPDAVIEPSSSKAARRLFEADFPAESTVLLEREAGAASGTAGTPAAASAQIVVDQDQRVEIDATVPASGGYLVLADTFDPTWRVEVDGASATLLRANGLFRAVRLEPGTHRVRFEHDHAILKAWLPVSGVGWVVLAVVFVRPSRRHEPLPQTAREPRAA